MTITHIATLQCTLTNSQDIFMYSTVMEYFHPPWLIQVLNSKSSKSTNRQTRVVSNYSLV